MSKKYTEFQQLGVIRAVNYIESQVVKDGVTCDIYRFVGDDSEDLAIVRVESGFKTPLQRILKGEKTVEGFLSGEGTLSVISANGVLAKHTFSDANENEKTEVEVKIGEIMQWHAGSNGLEFYEICQPPYEDGRFEDLTDDSILRAVE